MLLRVPTSAAAVGLRERPVFLESGPQRLFAILAEPETPSPSRVGVVMLHARNRTHTANRNRSGVGLSRAFAKIGVASIRFDFHGSGDSTGDGANGLVRQAGLDVITAAQCLADAGYDRIVLSGICYGAMAGLMVGREIPGLVGVSMLNPPFASLKKPGQTRKLSHNRLDSVLKTAMRKEVFRLLARDPEYRRFVATRARRRLVLMVSRTDDTPGQQASPPEIPPVGEYGDAAVRERMSGAQWAVAKLQPLVEAGVQVRMFVDQHEKLYRDFEQLKEKELGDLIEQSNGRVRTVVAPDTKLGMQTSLGGQAFVAHAVVDFVSEVVAEYS
jgi:alpha/beta superfamily hydrolase